MENRSKLILLLILLIGIIGYYWFNSIRLKSYYEIEFWWAIDHDKGEKALQKIESDMHKDGYDGEQISRIRQTGTVMVLEQRKRVKAGSSGTNL